MDSYDPFILILAGQSDLRRIMEFAHHRTLQSENRHPLPHATYRLEETKAYVTHHLKRAAPGAAAAMRPPGRRA